MNNNDWETELMYASWSLETTKQHLEELCYNSNANRTHKDICKIALTSIKDILSDYEMGAFDYMFETETEEEAIAV